MHEVKIFFEELLKFVNALNANTGVFIVLMTIVLGTIVVYGLSALASFRPISIGVRAEKFQELAEANAQLTADNIRLRWRNNELETDNKELREQLGN